MNGGNVSLKRDKETETDTDVIVDLDALTTKKVTFILGGQTHVLLPITTQVFLEFWDQVLKFKKEKQETVKLQNEAYYQCIAKVCRTITRREVEKMTLMQKSLLIEALTAKITGDKRIFEQVQSLSDTQKKKLNGPDSALLN